MGTEKSQPEGPTFQRDTRLAEFFSTGAVNPRVGISCRHWKSMIDSFSHMPSRKQCPLLSFLTRKCRNKMAKIKKKSTKPTYFVTKRFPLFQLRQCILTLDVFVNKSRHYKRLKIWIAFSQPNAANIETRRHSLIIWNIMMSTSGVGYPVFSNAFLTYPCTVDSRYLEFQGTLWNASRYPYLDISELQNWGKK